MVSTSKLALQENTPTLVNLHALAVPLDITVKPITITHARLELIKIQQQRDHALLFPLVNTVLIALKHLKLVQQEHILMMIKMAA